MAPCHTLFETNSSPPGSFLCSLLMKYYAVIYSDFSAAIINKFNFKVIHPPVNSPLAITSPQGVLPTYNPTAKSLTYLLGSTAML